MSSIATGRRPALRAWTAGGMAAAWYALTTFALGLPNALVVAVLGGLVALSAPPDPHRGVAVSRRNLGLAALLVVAYVPVAVGMDLLLGRIPIVPARAVLATFAALCVVLPRFAQTSSRATVLGRRELIVAVTTLVAVTRSYQAGDLWLTVVGLAVLVPVVLLVRRPGRWRRAWLLQVANRWLLLALLGAAGLSGMFFVWWVFVPGAAPFVVGAFWVGLGATAVLVAFPRARPSVAADVLVLAGSVVLAVQLVAIARGPTDAVVIGVPVAGQWQVTSAGRSTLVNAHRTLRVQRDAVDLVRFVDGRTFRGEGSRLTDFAIFGEPVLAVADGRVTAAVDGHPDLPVGGHTARDMAGNHVILDIGDGHFVLYGHLREGSLRVAVGDQVRRGQVVGEVGDSGNSDQPHLHLQVQNMPTFDVEDATIRTYPMIVDGATVADPRRGDTVQPRAD